jgi:ADP-ribose pyrophosphatase YjhB (NUDIX family)
MTYQESQENAVNENPSPMGTLPIENGEPDIQPGAEVVVAALTDNNEVLLVHGRSAADQTEALFLPTTSIAPDEKPEQAAARHLQEECEYQAKQFDDLGTLHSSVQHMNWQCHVFMARKLVHVPGTHAVPPAVTIDPMPIDKMDEFIQAGRLNDATTIAALHLVRNQLTAETSLTLWDVIVVSRSEL